MKINNKLESLRNIMSRHNIDAYIVPTCDFHGSEYVGDYFKTREYITGFDGSAGTAVITLDKALLWTDGRYFLQAEEQLSGSEFDLMRMGGEGVPTVKEYLTEMFGRNSLTAERSLLTEMSESSSVKSGNGSLTIAFDGRMIPSSEAEEFMNIPNVRLISDVDLIGEIWTDRPGISCKTVWKLPLEYAGISTDEKLSAIRAEMKKENSDAFIVSALDEVAWILNLRGDDVKCNPVFMAFMVITMDDAVLFAQKPAFSPEILEYLSEENITLKDYYDIYNYVESFRGQSIWLDKATANFNLINAIELSNKIIDKFTPALQMKAIKNDVEIKNIEKAHLLDGVAMTKFIYWLKTNVARGNLAASIDKATQGKNATELTEVSLAEVLEKFRSKAESYVGPSFDTIVGYKEHGAIVHYSATPDTDYKIMSEGMVLIDSGGHYLEGTTDITRTISLGKVSDRMREMYTAVLRGNLNLAAATFKEGCTGVSLDYLARKPLWEKGLDYNHGTGHGVGYLLNVHEAPNAFRYKILEDPQLNPVLKPGMLTSDEPGVYLEGEFGIRLENLILCKEKYKNEYGTFLGFTPMTLVPFDKELIDKTQMSVDECALLDEYHKMIYEKVSPYLTEEECEWLEREIIS